MKFNVYSTGSFDLAEVVSDSRCLSCPNDALDIMANAGARTVLMHRHQIAPDFFRLKTGLAGEILQKLTNYGVRLAVIGDFTDVMTDSLRDFIRESNRGRRYLFVPNREEAIRLFSME